MACGPADPEEATQGADLSTLPDPSGGEGNDAGDAASAMSDATSVSDGGGPDGRSRDGALQCMTACLADDALALKIMSDIDACYDACPPVDPGVDEEPPCFLACDAQIDQACEGAPASCEHHDTCWAKCFPDVPVQMP
jgi:hypothetical protein